MAKTAKSHFNKSKKLSTNQYYHTIKRFTSF